MTATLTDHLQITTTLTDHWHITLTLLTATLRPLTHSSCTHGPLTHYSHPPFGSELVQCYAPFLLCPSEAAATLKLNCQTKRSYETTTFSPFCQRTLEAPRWEVPGGWSSASTSRTDFPEHPQQWTGTPSSLEKQLSFHQPSSEDHWISTPCSYCLPGEIA